MCDSESLTRCKTFYVHDILANFRKFCVSLKDVTVRFTNYIRECWESLMMDGHGQWTLSSMDEDITRNDARYCPYAA